MFQSTNQKTIKTIRHVKKGITETIHTMQFRRLSQNVLTQKQKGMVMDGVVPKASKL